MSRDRERSKPAVSGAFLAAFVAVVLVMPAVASCDGMPYRAPCKGQGQDQVDVAACTGGQSCVWLHRSGGYFCVTTCAKGACTGGLTCRTGAASGCQTCQDLIDVCE